jgi:hypothetical protein
MSEILCNPGLYVRLVLQHLLEGSQQFAALFESAFAKF